MATGIKRRVFEILEEGAAGDTTSTLVDTILILLIIVNVLAVILQTVPEYGARYGNVFAALELFSVILFTVEYCARLWVADQHGLHRHLKPTAARFRYAVSPAALIDLAAILPFYISLFFPFADLRLLRVFRLVRFFKLTRYSPGVRSLSNAIVSEWRALLGSLVIILGMVILAATILYVVESAAQPDAFGSIPAAMWWAMATLSTVGYGDVVPITAWGKVMAGIVMIMGYGLFAMPIGIIATAFAREIHQRDFVVTWGMVARVPIFAQLSASEIAEVMQLLRAQRAPAGSQICRAGEPAHSMYFIVSGMVNVDIAGRQFELGDGDFFGEIAVLRRTLRSATVVAMHKTNLLALDADDLHHLMRQNTAIRDHIHTVAQERVGESFTFPYGDVTADEIVPKSDK